MPTAITTSNSAFILKVWHTPHWRARLQDVHTGDVRYFDSPEALLEYLSSLLNVPGGTRPGLR